MSTTKIFALLLLAAGIIAAGYYLYTKRKSEQYGTGLVVKPPHEIAPVEGTVAGGDVAVSITAASPNDPYPRDWNIFTKDPSGSYQGAGKWGKADPIHSGIFNSGGTWIVNLSRGTYYFVVGDSSGVTTYTGTITQTGKSPIPFGNNDVNHASRFEVT